MAYIQLSLEHMTSGFTSGDSYIAFMTDITHTRTVPIVLNGNSVRTVDDNLLAPTDRTPHMLLHEMMLNFDIHLKGFYIDSISDGVFNIVGRFTDGFNEHDVRCTVADMVVLSATEHECPVMMKDSVYEEVSCPIELFNGKYEANGTPTVDSEDTAAYIVYLQDMLKDCEEREAYEEAAKIQKEIEDLKKKI